jgi:hypothetical protein
MAASTLSRTPTSTELASRQLIQSANRNPVESNVRRNTTSSNKNKSPRKERQEQPLDNSDLLIESGLIHTNHDVN